MVAMRFFSSVFLVATMLTSAQAGEVLVASAGNNNVPRYNDLTGVLIDVFATDGPAFPNNLSNPTGLAIGIDGNVLVSSSFGANSVLRYDGATGDFIDIFASGGGLDTPAFMVLGPDMNLYVVSSGSDNVLRYDGTTGAFLEVFTSGGQLNSPIGIAFGPDGNLYVGSQFSDNVLRYNGSTGNYIDVFAEGSGLDNPLGLVFGQDDNLYVNSNGSDNILRYDGSTGTFIDVFASGGGLIDPVDLAFGPDSNLYVTDQASDIVLRYDGASGAFIDIFISGGVLDGPGGLLFLNSIPEPISLDIKPGSDPNSVNLKSKGVLPVAILSTEMFDVSDINVSTLLFGDPVLLDNNGTAAGPLRYAFEDVSDDGLLDLTLKFSLRDLVDYDALGPNTIAGLLTGELFDGTLIEGLDSIRIVPPNGNNASSGNSIRVTAIPEPSSFLLAATLLALLSTRRRSC